MITLKFYDRDAPKLLQAGKIIAFPTETVFGLGIRFDDISAFNELVRVKRRSPDKPFTLMGGDNTNISDYAKVDARIQAVISAFFPGPLTIILKANPNLPEHVTLGTGKIGIRISGDKRVRDLIDETGVPLLVPSANISGEDPCSSDKEIKKIFKNEIAAVISGVCLDGIPSTIIDLSKEGEISLIREGELKMKDIEEVFFDEVSNS